MRFLVIIILISNTVYSIAQIQDYKIHSRGMLHETVFNTGEIGRGWTVAEAFQSTNVPLMEWPPVSGIIIGGMIYGGQENSIGAGIHISANLMGKSGTSNRLYSFCGGVGSSIPEVSFGVWSFPLALNRTENYPVLSNGSLNPQYNPDEAEEIIIAKWSTNIGITVTRTSRTWSYPDYDDLIIYEYEMEYNGDTDGNPITIERDSTLSDVLFSFSYGFAPSLYGYQRNYGTWRYTGGMYRGDQRSYFDASLWLSFNMDVQTSLDTNLVAKPEPDPVNFLMFSQTKENGGGLCSPQAPGWNMLYYDTTHLAICNPYDSTQNESEATKYLQTYNNTYFELDQNMHMLQPFRQKVGSGYAGSTKMKTGQGLNPSERSDPYSPVSTTYPIPPQGWIGRSAFNYKQSNDAVNRYMVFGPYTLHKGDKVKFALAEVIGYGGQAGKNVEGGQQTTQWSTIPSLDRKVVLSGQTMTEHYLTDYGYPDYVNSKVKTVQDAAIKSFQAYRGQDTLNLPVFPEQSPRNGSYKIPVPFPAPAISLANSDNVKVGIRWSRNIESFTHPRLIAPLSRFKIYKSTSQMGPWDSVKTYNIGEGINTSEQYEYIENDPNFKIGDSRYYAVTSVDAKGNESGKTNMTLVKNLPYDRFVKCLLTSGSNIFAGTYEGGGVFLSTNNGATWTQKSNGLLNHNILTIVSNGNNIYAGTWNGVFYSTDNGSNWIQNNDGLQNKWVYSLAVKGTNIFAGTDSGFCISTNNGINWTSANNGLPYSTKVYSIAMVGENIFAGITSSNFFDNAGLYLSTNYGTSWNKINNGMPTIPIYTLNVNGNNFFAGTMGGVYVSTDNGSNWTPSGILSSAVFSLALSGNNIFAGTEKGIFLSSNSGINWVQLNDSLINSYVPSLAIAGNNIFAGTDLNGLCRSTDNGAHWMQVNKGLINSTGSYTNVLPQGFTLSQNYPNPFNPSTVISYSLPSASNVKLIIYNTLGQKIKTLESGYKTAGNYSINFNAANLPSGIYFYKLEAGSFSQIKKMMLIK
jgi:photosystem II stability/assembly factor-like uncharacterized protein